MATSEKLHHRHDFRELLEPESCDIVQPDLTHRCGLSELKNLAAVADMHSLLTAPQNDTRPVATAANLHLSATLTNITIQESSNDF